MFGASMLQLCQTAAARASRRCATRVPTPWQVRSIHCRTPPRLPWPVGFGAACRCCPLRARCTTNKTGRSLTLHRRTRSDFQAVYRRHRPMVERSIAWLVAGRNRGCGSAEPRPTISGCTTRVAGLNLRRLLNLGLTRTDGAWTVA